jgi:hypothetical protein
VVADDPLSLHELKVTSKTGEQRRRQQRQAEKAARGVGRGSHLGASVEEIDVNEAELQGVPVLWVQVGGPIVTVNCCCGKPVVAISCCCESARTVDVGVQHWGALSCVRTLLHAYVFAVAVHSTPSNPTIIIIHPLPLLCSTPTHSQPPPTMSFFRSESAAACG